MPDLSRSRNAILTPCIGVCHLDRNGFCEGCHRSVEEIAGWLNYTDEQRRELISRVLPRRAERAAP
jgi:predicted Fe-S protein YdhL (DUF1289 family)